MTVVRIAIILTLILNALVLSRMVGLWAMPSWILVGVVGYEFY